MDIDADFELLGQQFDFLNDEKNDLLTEHNYAKQPQADDVDKHEQEQFLCQLTCQSADIMSSLCGVGVRVRMNNFFSKTTRPRDMLFFLKDTLSIEDEKLFKACKSVCSSVC